MPTALPRFQVTQTAEIERALKIAQARWPEATRSELVARLFAAGAETLSDEHTKRRERRLGAVDVTSGLLDAVYEPDYLEKLREEWPE